MVILGLGSNIGDRLNHLRKALQAIKQMPGVNVTNVSPIYLSDALLPENADPDWNMPHLNCALQIETQLDPVALLQAIKEIEKKLGRPSEKKRWASRIIDIDILAWDDLLFNSKTLTIPHPHLLERPFALWPLADLVPLWICPLLAANGKTAGELVEKWGSRFSQTAPFRTHQLHQRIDTAQLMGILNVTPDSYSDGGLFNSPENALAHAMHLVSSGAEVIDVGAESTSPRAQAITPQEEWNRLEAVLQTLKEAQGFIIPPKISIDTRHVEVASKALEMGVDWINDVSGLDDPAMRALLLSTKADCVIMHHLCLPERRDQVLPRNQDPVKLVYEWGEQRLNELIQAGFDEDRLIFDPGIGFGKMAEQSLFMLKNIEAFKTFGIRILIGHSRKTFMSLFTQYPFPERDIETLAMSLWLNSKAVDYLRVHNVEMCARGFKAINALSNQHSPWKNWKSFARVSPDNPL